MQVIRVTATLAAIALAPIVSNGYPDAGSPPALVGLDPNKPKILPITVQAAYNDDTMFFHISWEGDPGDYHDYLHFIDGAWRSEGSPRREAQSTIDNDPDRGPTNAKSTIYESRVAFMVDDPTGPNAVPDFDRFGCFLTCHDNSRAMPAWVPPADTTKYLNDGTAGTLDLWHHRLHRANPIGLSDDQNVKQIPLGGEAGGRFGDTGNAPFQTNSIAAGKPTYTLDNEDRLTGNSFAFAFAGLFTDPLRFFRDPSALELGAPLVAGSIDYATAESRGYIPSEGDTIPARRLRTGTESRGNITAFGTTFTPSPGDPLFGRIDSNTQRLLDTGNADDTALVPGNVYNIAFAVHTGQVTVRDHYVGFAKTLSLGEGAADIVAVQIAGSGTDSLPDFSNAETFPVTDINLFQPGIASLEFLLNQNTGIVYIDPVTQQPVDQSHSGADGLLNDQRSCTDCHTAATVGEPAPSLFNAGSMEALAPQRGGVNTATPIPEPFALALQLAAMGTLAVVARRRF
jgi:hypothetical protein